MAFVRFGNFLNSYCHPQAACHGNMQIYPLKTYMTCGSFDAGGVRLYVDKQNKRAQSVVSHFPASHYFPSLYAFNDQEALALEQLLLS